MPKRKKGGTGGRMRWKRQSRRLIRSKSTSPINNRPTTIASIDPGRKNIGVVVYDYVSGETVLEHCFSLVDNSVSDRDIKTCEVADLTVANLVLNPLFAPVLSARIILIEEQVFPGSSTPFYLRSSLDKNIRMSSSLRGALLYASSASDCVRPITYRPGTVQNYFKKKGGRPKMIESIANWKANNTRLKWTYAVMCNWCSTKNDHLADCWMMIGYWIEKSGASIGARVKAPYNWPDDKNSWGFL